VRRRHGLRWPRLPGSTWHEETRGGVREVDGRFWAVWVYEEWLPGRWATAKQALDAAERGVAPRRAWLE
jgi:hypothetical protein